MSRHAICPPCLLGQSIQESASAGVQLCCAWASFYKIVSFSSFQLFRPNPSINSDALKRAGYLRRWASLHPTVPAPQVPAQDRGSRDMPVPDSSASSCRCYGCRPIRRRHGAGSCRGSSTTVSCMRCRARHTRRFSFFHPHVTQSSNPLSAMPHGVLIRHKRI